MKSSFIFLFLFSFLIGQVEVSAQQPTSPKKTLNSDPNMAQIVSSDIDLFWKAYDKAKPENNINVFRDEYLRNGSIGLKDFTEARIESACELVATIEARPKYYASLRDVSQKASTFKEPMRQAFRKLKNIYPDAVFPDVYLLIGRMNSGGTYTENALLIGVDMYGITPATPKDELSDWHKQVLKPIDEIPYIVAHELIHYQQKYPKGDRTLLSASIGEGSADFIAQLIAGNHINKHLHDFGDPKERELWLEFKQSMTTNDTSLWLYNGNRAKDRPADLGYYMGYKIAEAYYKNAADKNQAVRDILEIKDFSAFRAASKYEAKFGSTN
ncbi:MAG TPA: DUF2268 domain-containing putative Zn-dependent protease [Pyrinomonadaceae bacterium]|nr:hypothetical protein [Acidobacteriota bacterium]HQZ95507.1 DUF2268 domain-containing putative Zn-dependent protease [Pyrinomonadaceae bacterium]